MIKSKLRHTVKTKHGFSTHSAKKLQINTEAIIHHAGAWFRSTGAHRIGNTGLVRQLNNDVWAVK